jgi:hypothetical protein
VVKAGFILAGLKAFFDGPSTCGNVDELLQGCWFIRVTEVVREVGGIVDASPREDVSMAWSVYVAENLDH